MAAAAAVVAILSACEARSVVPVARPGPTSSVSSAQVRDTTRVAATSVRVMAMVGADGSSSRGLVSVGSELLESVDTAEGGAVRAVAANGRVRLQVDLGGGMRAAGLALAPAGLWQFTVDGDVAVLRDPATLHEIRRVRVGAGWGACSTGEVVVHSDGTNTLTARDMGTLVERRSVRITGHWVAAQRLGGLACVRAEGRPQVWALVAGSDWVVRVDPTQGVVTAVASLARIRAEKVGLGGAIGAITATSVPDEFWVSGAFPYRFKVRLDAGS